MAESQPEDKVVKLRTFLVEINSTDDDAFQAYMDVEFGKATEMCRQRQLRQSRSVGAAVDPDCPWYPFDNLHRGLVLVLLNEKFMCADSYRQGSQADKASLRETFTRLGFDVVVLENLGKDQMKKAAKKASTCYDHSGADCFVCVISTHGREEDGGEYGVIDHMLVGSDGGVIPTKEIVAIFEETPGLERKPRLFFIQACRGRKYDPGVHVVGSGGDQPEATATQPGSVDAEPVEETPQEDPHKAPPGGMGGLMRKDPPTPEPIDPPAPPLNIRSVPLYQDCLIMYATPPGFFAWKRNTGSWLIQLLCNFLDSVTFNQEEDPLSLLSGLTSVSDRVARTKQSETYVEDKHGTNVPESHAKKQMPVIDTMLTKDIIMNWRSAEQKRVYLLKIQLNENIY